MPHKQNCCSQPAWRLQKMGEFAYTKIAFKEIVSNGKILLPVHERVFLPSRGVVMDEVYAALSFVLMGNDVLSY